MDFIKSKNFCSSKDTIKGVKGHRMRKKKCKSDKALYLDYIKNNHLLLSDKQTIDPIF